MNKNGKKVLMNMMMQKRKACNHPYLFLENGYPLNDDIVNSSGKFEMLDRILPKLIRAKHRTLIFSQMTKLLDIFEVYFEHRQIKYLRLDGTTKTEDRVDRIAQFNSPESDYYVFVLSTRAGGLGLNLQTADTVIFVDSDWNPQMDRQAQDRAHRIGQKREVRVFRLVTNTETEENILSKAFLKKNLDDIVIQAGLFNQNSTDVERKNQIEEIFKKQDAEEDDEDENGVPTDKDINQMLARDDEELEIYNMIDQERYLHDQGTLGPGVVQSMPHYRLMRPEEVPEWVAVPVVKLGFIEGGSN